MPIIVPFSKNGVFPMGTKEDHTALPDTKLRNLKAKDKPYQGADGRGPSKPRWQAQLYGEDDRHWTQAGSSKSRRADCYIEID